VRSVPAPETITLSSATVPCPLLSMDSS
jgi:hypothetical protein